MQLDCYRIYSVAPQIVPGRSRREWMDAFTDRHPYRCLPLTMANSTGWEILCPIDIEIEWNGGELAEAIQFRSSASEAEIASFAGSHFRRGIVTFHTGHLFRTPPGWAVWCNGAPNWPKDGIYPLSGLIETDWLPFPFTMNWQMTRPGKVRFEKDEPFCFITLVEHDKLETVQPQLRMLDDDEKLKEEFEAWKVSRTDFNRRLEDQEAEAMRTRWQRHYMRGESATGSAADAHKTKRRLPHPVEAKKGE
tara:strand:- start:614 stop:1360 length:747 start_codon:yes stop_codon:yes gene_type:complete